MTTNNMQLQKLLATACACGLVIASAGFGAVYAYRVGSEHSTLLAILSVLMALGLEGCKPLAICLAMKCKSARVAIPMACLGLVAVTYSLTAELSLMASNKSDLAATRTAQSEAAREAVGKRQRITDELRSLGLQRPSESIQAELNAILTDKRLNNCQGWLANVSLREICIDQVSPLQAELAKADRREKLEAELGQAPENHESVSVADPGSTAMATYLNSLGFVVPIEIIGQWLVLVPVLALELGSAMAMVLVQAITTPSSASVRASNLMVLEPPRASSRTTKAQRQAAEMVVNRLIENGGSLTDTERGLAHALGTSKPTLRRALLLLGSMGVVSVAATRQGTRLNLMQRSLPSG